ncbi:hypothetical protein [Chiayiivirga flava]|uniref:Delta-60 repeat domain-containing protein n=1 Tax=Chiayiivirga flava TaxID=659595 RepID=A0A7W8D5X2_9GAMM|nr:hypothetical protein [Chiayiivirga flava]MBB5207301.1 hypothetical protein [Chiayiivirga flava]
MRRILLSSLLFACPALACAGPPAGQIDPTFWSSDGGVEGLQLEGFDIGGDLEDRAGGMAVDGLGRFLVVGMVEDSADRCLGVMRFTASGQLDKNGFGFDTNAIPRGKICHTTPMVLEPAFPDMNVFPLTSGFLVSGIGQGGNPFVCRFAGDGDLIAGFGSSGCVILGNIDVGVSWPAPDVIVADGSVLVVANDRSGGMSTPVLSRLALSDGALQPFGQDGFVSLLGIAADAFVWDTLLTPDGDLIIVGNIVIEPNDTDAFIARFDLDSSAPDPNFSGDGMVRFKFNQVELGQEYLQAVTMTADGDILAAGLAELPGAMGLALLRVDAMTGTLSPSFNGGVPKLYDPCAAIGGCSPSVKDILADDAQIVVVAGGPTAAPIVARLKAIGDVDTEFGDQGTVVLEPVSRIAGAVLQEGRIVVAGTAPRTTTVLIGNVLSQIEHLDFGLLRLSDGRLFKDHFEAITP